MENVVHPHERARIDLDLARAMDATSSGRFVLEHRLRRSGSLGEPWVLSQGEVYFSGPENARRPVRVFGNLQDINTRKLAEIAVRESEERQAFLLKLSDTLRPLIEPIEIVAQATRLLGNYMQADRTFIAMMEPDGVRLHVHDKYLRPGVSSVIGRRAMPPGVSAGRQRAYSKPTRRSLRPYSEEHWTCPEPLT